MLSGRSVRIAARLLLLAAVPVAYVACSSPSPGAQAVVPDERVLPPARRVFESASRNFALSVSTADQWQTPSARVTLQQLAPAPVRTVWEQTLPQEHGPRRVIVTNQGVVVMVDEWINVPSRFALMILDARGQRVANYSLDELITTLAVPRSAISANATLGIWLSAEPVLTADGGSVSFRVGGRGLIVRLSDGVLTATE
jgi:hypothetical protein